MFSFSVLEALIWQDLATLEKFQMLPALIQQESGVEECGRALPSCETARLLKNIVLCARACVYAVAGLCGKHEAKR